MQLMKMDSFLPRMCLSHAQRAIIHLMLWTLLTIISSRNSSKVRISTSRTWWTAIMDNMAGIKALDTALITCKWWDRVGQINNRFRTLIIRISIWMDQVLKLWVWCSRNNICNSIRQCNNRTKVPSDRLISIILRYRAVRQKWWDTHLTMQLVLR